MPNLFIQEIRIYLALSKKNLYDEIVWHYQT